MDAATGRLIVVPTDFSATADHALDAAVDLARGLSARLSVIHVTAPTMLLPPPFDVVSIPSLFPDLPRRVAEGLEARAARVREAGLTCDTQELEGSPHVEIVRYAVEAHADLLVLGTHGRSGIAHAVLGSVAERVVHRAPCPVVMVPDRSAAPARR